MISKCFKRATFLINYLQYFFNKIRIRCDVFEIAVFTSRSRFSSKTKTAIIRIIIINAQWIIELFLSLNNILNENQKWGLLIIDRDNYCTVKATISTTVQITGKITGGFCRDKSTEKEADSKTKTWFTSLPNRKNVP